MRPRRLAFLETIAQSGGGAQISLLELIRAVDGDPKIIVVLPEDGPLRELAMAAGAEVRVLPWPDRLLSAGERAGGLSARNVMRSLFAGAAVPGMARRLAKLLDEIDADALITNGIKAHILGAMARRRRPLIWYLREGQEGRALSTSLMRMLGWRCAGAIAISRFIESEARQILPRSVPIQVVYNLVDFSRFTRNAPRPPDLLKAEGETWFCMVGALTPLKGQDLFLQAACRVAGHLPNARFLIVGSNYYKTEAGSSYVRDLHRLAEDPVLAGRVMFLGQRNDVASIFTLVDVLVQPNRGPEGLGRSVLEAMSCAIPVIAVDRWGPAELISDGETGFLTPVLDVSALADRMERLALDPALRVKIGNAAQRWVHAELAPQRIVTRFREFIHSIVK